MKNLKKFYPSFTNTVKKIVVLKNDAIGDTMHSIPCINEILNLHSKDEIFFFLSKRNEVTYSFFKKKNTKLRVFNYSLNIIEKIKIFYFFLFNKIDKTYILTPKNFYFYLPLFFIRTKFYGVCLNAINNKFRPYKFLRKFLHFYVINDRTGIKLRKPLKILQLELLGLSKTKNVINTDFLKSNFNYSFKNKFIFFHFKKNTFDKLNWDFNNVRRFLEVLSEKKHLVFTTDIEGNNYTKRFKELFNFYDNNGANFVNRNSNITYFHEISGVKLLKIIAHSSLTIAVHGSFTNVSSYLNIPTIDLFHIKSNKKIDIKASRDASIEFSPFNKSYFRIVPSDNFEKLINKVKMSINNAK